MNTEISFEIGEEDAKLVDKICDRVVDLLLSIEGFNIYVESRIDLEMDIVACHLNGCPLDLKKLLGADNFNLVHDVGGIRRHMNRTTGKLEDCFLPRCATKQ